MDQYFAIQDKELLEKYPDIKVLKKMEPIRVAAYTAYSTTPEDDCFEFMQKWAREHGLLGENIRYHLYGFDIPGSLEENGKYRYEVWMTLPQNFECMGDLVEIKEFEGGEYAVTTTTIGEITATWDRFREWLRVSKYDLGEH